MRPGRRGARVHVELRHVDMDDVHGGVNPQSSIRSHQETGLNLVSTAHLVGPQPVWPHRTDASGGASMWRGHHTAHASGARRKVGRGPHQPHSDGGTRGTPQPCGNAPGGGRDRWGVTSTAVPLVMRNARNDGVGRVRVCACVCVGGEGDARRHGSCKL